MSEKLTKPNFWKFVQKISRHIFAILAVVSLVLALMSFFFFERGALGASEEKYFSAVKERVKYELNISQRELGEVMPTVMWLLVGSLKDEVMLIPERILGKP